MATRTIKSEDAAAAAEIARLVRARPEDLADPRLPSSEMEVLVDMGARGHEPPGRPRVVVAGGHIVGVGVVDAAPGGSEGVLVGPVVHPVHRRRGHGRALLEALLAAAREAGIARLRASVGERNAAGRALLEGNGFTLAARQTCLRLARPPHLGELPVEDVAIERVVADAAFAYAEFARGFVPRSPRLTEALVKSSDYVVLLATRGGEPVGCCEVDLRFGEIGSVEYLHAPPDLLRKDLGPALLLEAARHAFGRDDVKGLDLLVPGARAGEMGELGSLGFEARGGLLAYQIAL